MTSRRVKQVSAWAVWTASGLLVIAILVGLLVWGIVATQRASERRDAQIAALIQTVRDDNHDAAQDRTTATANQRALLDYTATLAARQDALLAYLRAHGIHLPQRLVTVVPRPRIIVRHHHAHRSGSRNRHRSSRTTSGTSSSGVKQPGKSGGHRRHPHRPHRH